MKNYINKKNILLVLLLVCLLAGLRMFLARVDKVSANMQASEAEAATVLTGDVNGDGKVNLQDAQFILRKYLKLVDTDEGSNGACDVNGDGKVDLKDAQLVLRYYLKIITEFPKASEASQDEPGQSAASTDNPDSETQEITTNGGTKLQLSELSHWTNAQEASVVFYTSNISSEALMEIYDKLEWSPTGKVAVKLSTGESSASNNLSPDLIKELVQSLNGTIVECNTAYGGSRSSTAMHKQVAKERGYTAIADVDIMDEDGSLSIPVKGGTRLTEDLVGAHFANYDSYLILSHFKGHAMAGFGGAIKNISIGIGSSQGKVLIHTGGERSTGSVWGGNQDAFLEAMAEAGKGVSDYLGNGERIVYVNVMNRISVDCDCDGSPAKPDMHDIGILASTDPVALDQACVDLIYAVPDGNSVVKRMESRSGIHTLEHAEEIGLGSRTYRLVDIDE